MILLGVSGDFQELLLSQITVVKFSLQLNLGTKSTVAAVEPRIELGLQTQTHLLGEVHDQSIHITPAHLADQLLDPLNRVILTAVVQRNGALQNAGGLGSGADGAVDQQLLNDVTPAVEDAVVIGSGNNQLGAGNADVEALRGNRGVVGQNNVLAARVAHSTDSGVDSTDLLLILRLKEVGLILKSLELRHGGGIHVDLGGRARRPIAGGKGRDGKGRHDHANGQNQGQRSFGKSGTHK